MRAGLLAAAVFVAAALSVSTVAAPRASAASTASKKLTVWAVPATVQFMNHADDRLRGMSTNPFKIKSDVIIIGAGGKEKGFGPFPGDNILYGFKVYGDAGRTRQIGTAMFTCYYTFAKKATCDSYFDLADGVLLASGQIPFGKTTFSLAVSGGTQQFFGALGQANSVAGHGNAQRFDIHMTGLPK